MHTFRVVGGLVRRLQREVLCPQPSVLEWRILGPCLGKVVADGRQLVVVGPPKHPHLPGLLHEGLDQRQLVWIQAWFKTRVFSEHFV
jgi:protein ImuA